MRITESLRFGWRFLFPHNAEQDEGFRMEVERAGRRSLYILATALAVMIVLVYPPLISYLPGVTASSAVVLAALTVTLCVIGSLFAVARSPMGLRYGRGLSLLAMFVVAAVAVGFDMRITSNLSEAEKFVLGDAMGTLLIAVVVVPALPIQMLLLGLGIVAAYGVSYFQLGYYQASGEHSLVTMSALLTFDAVFCMILSAHNYRRHWTSYRSHQQVLETQRTLLITDNAASMGKLAAALSHELNNALGILKSSMGTLKDLRARLPGAEPARRAKLEESVLQLESNSDKALERMEGILRRMQRFTNLDRAEERDFHIDGLVEDVVSLLDPEARADVKIELDLGGGPGIYFKPQMLSAVLSRLVQDSVRCVSPDGWVRVSTRSDDGQVKIRIQDSRRPIPPRDLRGIFEPQFRVSGGRVTAGNWTWFNARQILREHGGELSVYSDSEATVTTISIPRGRP